MGTVVRKYRNIDMDAERLAELFEKALQKASEENELDIHDVDCAVERDNAASLPKIEVRVYGLAGAAPRDKIHNKKTGKIAKGASPIKFEHGDKEFVFKLVDSFGLNTNDYLLVYQMQE